MEILQESYQSQSPSAQVVVTERKTAVAQMRGEFRAFAGDFLILAICWRFRAGENPFGKRFAPNGGLFRDEKITEE